MRSPLPSIAPLVLACVHLAAAEPASVPTVDEPASGGVATPFEIPPVGTASPDRFLDLFRPFRTEASALSPDGKRLAYSVRDGDSLYVVTLDVDAPTRALAKILVGTTHNSTPFLEPHISEPTPARIRWMGWATPDRLIIETNTTFVSGEGAGEVRSTSGGIYAINADGSQPRTLVTPRDVAIRTLDFESMRGQDDPLAEFRIFTPDQDPEEEKRKRISGDPLLPGGSDNDLPIDVQLPQSPTFFDYVPGESDWIIVRTADPKSYNLYQVNIYSGKMRFGPRENVAGDYATLINRQGMIGGVVPNTTRTPFPFSYGIAKPALFTLGRWNKLAKLAPEMGAHFTLSPQNFFGARAFPVGFGENPDLLYYASNAGRDTYAIYGLNLKTGQPSGHMIESPRVDLVSPGTDGLPAMNPLVFDRHTRDLAGVRYQGAARSAVWLREELRSAQASLEKTFPGRSVDLLEWDASINRILALVRGPTEPGSFYVLDRSSHQALFAARRSDLPSESEPRFSRYFTFENPEGTELTGLVVIPNAVRHKPIPTVVICPEDPWEQTPAEFDGEINALAQMGFAVVQVNPRGTWGFGTKHRAAVGSAFDETQTADIVAAIDALARTVPIHPHRVAIMGRGRGAFLALRAAQLRPDRFRCAVGIEPTVNLANWLSYNRWVSNDSGPALTREFFGDHLIAANPLFNDERPHERPVFILAYRGSEGGSPTQMYLDARSLVRSIKRQGTPAEFQNLSLDFTRRMPEARSDAMRHIEDFLNLNIYSHDVQMGDAKVTGTW